MAHADDLLSDLNKLRGLIDDVDQTNFGDMRHLLDRMAIIADRAINMENRPRHVTDHAILRYLERIDGVDMDAIRNAIRTLADEAEQFAYCDGLWHSSGLVLITNDNGEVVTILDDAQAQNYVGRRLANGARSAPAVTT